MGSPHTRSIQKFDLFFSILLFFLVLLMALFTYLQAINKNIQNYDLYQSKLRDMMNYERIVDNIFFKTHHFINYDRVSHASKNILQNIEFLRNSNFKIEFGNEGLRQLEEIERLFKKKNATVYHFQSINARASNTVYYLFDLRKTILSQMSSKDERVILIDEIFFQITTLLTDLDNNQNNSLLLKKLAKYKNDNEYLEYFYIQSAHFFQDIALLRQKIDENNEILLQEQIYSLSLYLESTYEKSYQQQKFITIAFFLIAFLVLMALFLSYKKIKKTSAQLYAFKFAVENSDNMILITNSDREIEYVNEAFEEIMQYKKEEVLGENPRILSSKLHDAKFYKTMNQTIEMGERWFGELTNKKKDGSLIYERASISPIVLNGKIIQYLAIKLDITNYIEQQQKLKRDAVVFEAIGDGIAILNSEAKVVNANQALCDIFGIKKEDLLERSLELIEIRDETEISYAKLYKRVTKQERWRGQVEAKYQNGSYLRVWFTLIAVNNSIGRVENYVAIYSNLEEIISMQERVNYLAFNDTLTHLPNRIRIETYLQELVECNKTKSEPFALLFIDLDRFKVINDTLGHEIGDEILITLSQKIKKYLNKNNFLGRFGGDEFVIILNEISSKQDIEKVAQRVLDIPKEQMSVKSYELTISASIGIATYPEHGEEYNILIKNADSALFDAKEQGKDNYKFYSTKLSKNIKMRHQLEQELYRAFDRGELRVEYQPQYSLESGKICGVEALVRWDSQLLGSVSPQHFIEIAEETGAIIKIGYFVFEEACKSFVYWKNLGIKLEWIAINMSNMQFRQYDLYEQYQKIIQRTGMESHYLELEITESSMMEYREENLAFIKKFRDAGSSISIDDFGTGYSSMSYLKNLPLDKIKIDKSFIGSISTNSRDKEVAAAIISLAKSLGYKVIVEGIETPEQEKILFLLGVEYGQGYHYSKSLNKEELVNFVKSLN